MSYINYEEKLLDEGGGRGIENCKLKREPKRDGGRHKEEGERNS